MNPQTLLFVKLTESTVGALPAERKSEFQFAVGETDMIGLVCGIVGTVAAQWLWRRLSKRPTPWASRRTVRIYDIQNDESRHITHDQSSDWEIDASLQSVAFGRCKSVPVSYEGN